MREKTLRQNGERSYFVKILLFAIPLMLSGLLQSLYNAADLIVVGQFEGDSALAAVGSTGSLTNLILGLFLGLSVGAGVSVAHSIGAKDYDEVQRTLHTSILTAVILGAVIGAVGFILAPTLLSLMDTPSELAEQATLYIRIIFIGSPFNVTYNYSASMLRASGDSKRPLIFLAVSGALNVCLNLLFVAVFGMGVAGVAVATVASQALSAALALIYMNRADTCLKFSLRRLRIHGKSIKKILAIGIPSGIQGTLFSFSNVMFQSAVNSLGPDAVTGNTAATSIGDFFYIAYHAFYDCALMFVGQSVGAKKYREIKKTVIACVLNIMALAPILTTFRILLREQLLGLYITDNDAAMEAARIKYLLVIWFYFLCGIMETGSGTLRALGRSTSSTVISLIGVCGFRIIWILTLFKMYPTMQCLCICVPFTWILTSGITFAVIWLDVRKKYKSQRALSMEAELTKA